MKNISNRPKKFTYVVLKLQRIRPLIIVVQSTHGPRIRFLKIGLIILIMKIILRRSFLNRFCMQISTSFSMTLIRRMMVGLHSLRLILIRRISMPIVIRHRIALGGPNLLILMVLVRISICTLITTLRVIGRKSLMKNTLIIILRVRFGPLNLFILFGGRRTLSH